jgi:hypothetical protein
VSYFILEDFRLGQDSRKSALTAAPGTLTTLVNAHITRGGDLEKRKAFVSTYTLPSGTFGLASLSGDLYVFGSGTDPGVPSGITYQRLQHPSAQAMTAVLNVEIFNGKLYVIAKYADDSIYHFYDGSRVTAFADGIARGSFDITGGTLSAGVNKVSAIYVNGVEVLGVAVDWGTSHSATATAVAAQITSYASSPEYSATASGATVIIKANAIGTTTNGYAISVTNGGNVTTSAPVAFSGGLASGTTLAPGKVSRTFGTKMYAISGSRLLSSAVDDPTDYTTGDGVDNINMSTYSSGSEVLSGLELFYDKMAVLAEEATQLWNLSADPEDSSKAQLLVGTGTRARRSVKPFGNGDVFYLADNGIRALKLGSTVSTTAQVSEVGTSIDTAVVDYLATLTDAEIAEAVAVVEPIDKRYWLAVGTKIYVYSFFPGSKIAAWSTYDLGFSVSDFAVVGKRVYARSGDTIYLYGGSANDTYDDCEVQFLVPYIDAQSPANPKTLAAIDTVAEGTWFIQMAANPDRPTDYDDIGTFTDTTLHKQTMPASGYSTYFAFLFTHEAEEYARFSRFVMHFEKDAAKAA